MEERVTVSEKKNRRKGLIISLIIHIGMILLALLPLLTYPDPPPGQEGILVNLGIPDVGEGEDNAPPAEVEKTETVEETVEEISEPEPVTPPEETVPEPAPEKEVIKTEVDEIKLKEEEERRKQQEELDRKKREEELQKKREEEARRKREEAERKKLEEEARKKAEAEKVKDEIGGLFGSGDGKGNTGKPGNQGDPGGDPNAENVEGISTGSGEIGGGLQGRGVVYSPTIRDRSQKTGKVVVKVCVNSAGRVIEARYTQRGSTTIDGELIRIAEESARKFKFSEGSLDKQCGTITIDFKLK